MPLPPVILANGSPVVSGTTFSAGETVAISLQSSSGYASIRWDLLEGPADSTASIVTSGATASIAPNVAGRFRVRCSVRGSDGLSASRVVALDVRTALRGLRRLSSSSSIAEITETLNDLTDNTDRIVPTASQTQHIPHLSALRAAAPEANSAAILAGRTSRGDGGGGAFYWDAQSTDADDGALTIAPASGSGRWKRVRPRGVVHAEWFGCSTANADNGPAIQAAIDAASGADGDGCTVILPTATQAAPLKVTTKIRIVDDTTHGNSRGVRLMGGGGNPSAFGGTVIRWDGANTGSIIDVHSRDCVVDGIVFVVKSGVTAACAIDITRASGAGAGVCTANTVRRCLFFAGSPYGAITNGIKFGDLVNNAYPANVENMLVDDCQFQSLPGAGIFVPNDSGQAKGFKVRECRFSLGAYGIHAPWESAGKVHVTVDNCAFSNLTATCIKLSVSHPLVVISPDVETCARFLELNVGSAAMQAVIHGGRLDMSLGIHSDKEYVRLIGAANVAFHGTEWVAWEPNVEPRIAVHGDYQTSVAFYGAQLPKLAGGVSSIVKTGASSSARLYLWGGCKEQTLSAPTTQAVDDRRVTYGANSQVTATWVPQ